MTEKLTTIIQKAVDDAGLNFPVPALEKLTKFCLENSPTENFLSTDLQNSLRYKMSPFVKQLCASEGGIYAIFHMLPLLENPRWGYFIGDACYNTRINPVDLIACLQRGPSSKALPSTLLFCSQVKRDMGAQFTSAFIDSLTSPRSWDTAGLSLALMLLDTKDKAALPALAEYKLKLAAAIKENTGAARERFAALHKQVKAAMVKIEDRKKKWWQFWK